jgi:hypothetical protein
MQRFQQNEQKNDRNHSKINFHSLTPAAELAQPIYQSANPQSTDPPIHPQAAR